MTESNEEKFMEMLAQADPELWRIKKTLVTTGVNPAVMSHIVRAVWSASVGDRKGNVRIKIDYDKDGQLVVASVRSEEVQGIGLPAIEKSEDK